jgi:hypothetical protein
VEQYFLDTAGAGRPKLFLNSGLKGRIADFDGLGLQKEIGYSPIVSEEVVMSKKQDYSTPGPQDHHAAQRRRKHRCCH